MQIQSRSSAHDTGRIPDEEDASSHIHDALSHETARRSGRAQSEEMGGALRIFDSNRPESSLPCEPPRASLANSSTQRSNRRYYQQNLSEEDRAALSQGECNHNLRVWDYNDLAKHHASRIEAVAYTDKRQEAIATILEEKRESERLLSKSKQQGRRFVRPVLNLFKTRNKSEAHKMQVHNDASRAMADVRAVSMPILSTPASPRPQTMPKPVALAEVEPHDSQQSIQDRLRRRTEHRDNNENVDITNQSLDAPESSSSPRSDGRSHFRQVNRARGLRRAHASNERPYTAKPDVTFDTFLGPHASGKGETYRGAQTMQPDEEPRGSIRRPRKMPSMPQLKKRASQAFGFGHKDQKG